MATKREPSDPAREGTCAAWVAEMVIRGERSDCHAMVGEMHENGWVVDAPMAHHIQKYVDMLRNRGGQIDVERRIRLNKVITGTSDATAVFADGHLIVDDLKYGYEIVEPTSPQIAIYAGGVMRYLDARDHKVTRVTLGIYQPRAYHPLGIYRSISMWPEDLGRQIRTIEHQASAALSPSAMATPGLHCRHCDGAGHCSAVAHTLYAWHARMLNGEQRHMNGAEIAEELDFLDEAEALLKARRDGVYAEAEARVKQGQRIPGREMQSGTAPRRWRVSRGAVEAATGIDPVDSTKMISPAEMERRGANPDVVSALCETPRTKARLKPVSRDYIAARFGGN